MRRSALLSLGLFAAIAIAACGTTTASSAPAASNPASQPAASGPAAGGTAVDIADFAFNPQSITVSAGDTVTWTNSDTAPHSVVFDDSSITSSENLNQGDTFEADFATAGTFAYICGIHSNMTGTVVVE